MSTFAIVAFGETLVLVSGEIDLSVGGSYGLGAMVMGLTWLHGVPFVLAVALGLGTGLVVGVFNAFVTTIVSVPSFLTTLRSLSLIQGGPFLISHLQSINPGDSLAGSSRV